MTFILNIYKKDTRTKSGRRIVGSYEFDRKDREAMDREVKELKPLYKEVDGYTIEVIDADS
jgi:hypothetical protein